MNMVPAFTTRPKVETEKVLFWFYNVAPCEMGLKSNFGSMVAALNAGSVGGQNVFEDHHTDRMLDSARKQRLIHAALSLISATHRATIEAAYEPRRYSDRLGTFFGPTRVGIAPITRTALGLQKKERNRDGILALLDAQQEVILQAIRAEADMMLVAAFKAFELRYGAILAENKTKRTSSPS